jgi:hypothetical protein
MSAWNDLVQKVYREGHAKNPDYSLGDAMKAAKKLYRKSKGTASVATGARRRTRRAARGRSQTRRRHRR